MYCLFRKFELIANFFILHCTVLIHIYEFICKSYFLTYTILSQLVDIVHALNWSGHGYTICQISEKVHKHFWRKRVKKIVILHRNPDEKYKESLNRKESWYRDETLNTCYIYHFVEVHYKFFANAFVFKTTKV